jgi:hypothetical protein
MSVYLLIAGAAIATVGAVVSVDGVPMGVVALAGLAVGGIGFMNVFTHHL